MQLRVRLFGKFSVCCGDRPLEGLGHGKAQELLAYLLVHRRRSHSREALAEVLWPETSPAQSKKNLRQILWQLQAGLKELLGADPERALLVDKEWVQFDGNSAVWLDVDEFEQLCERARTRRGPDPGGDVLAMARQAVDLYRGDLLDGWYQDWCGAERERLRARYLGTLDLVMDWYESAARYDSGIEYATLSLRHDPGRETTYQRLMRLHYLSGDRAGALRQYDRCVVALDEELDVKPSGATVVLYEQICADRLPAPLPGARRSDGAAPEAGAGRADALAAALVRMRRFELVLGEIEAQLHQDIETIERALSGEREPGVPRRPPARATGGTGKLGGEEEGAALPAPVRRIGARRR